MFLKFKVPLIFAGAAMALSFIIGILSGVRFSSILIRSIVMSLIGGGFSFAAKEILERFVPELFQSVLKKEAVYNSDESGKNLNISIDDPIDMSSMPPVNGEEDFSNAEKGEKNEADTVSTQIETDSTGTNTLNEDINTVNSLDEKAIKEEVFSNSKDAGSNVQTGQGVKETPSELEELPDLQEFAPVGEDSDASQSNDFVEDGTGRFNISADLNGSDMDTKTMVQAIRTVLKREA